MGCGSLLIFFTPFIILFIFFPLNFFSSLPLSFFYFPSLTPSKMSYFAFVATCFVTCCSSFSLLSNLLLLPHLSSLATIAFHCHSPCMSLLDAIAFHYRMPFPLIITCFIMVPSPLMHVVPTFHHHLFWHYYTYLLSPIAPLLVTQISANPTFHFHIIHHFYHSCCVCFEFMFTWYYLFPIFVGLGTCWISTSNPIIQLISFQFIFCIFLFS